MQREDKKNNKNNELAFINLFRIIGVVCITCIFHLSFSPFKNPPSFYTFISDHGRFFCEMFFIISGIMFYMFSYTKLVNHKISYGEFLIKKIKKYYPVMIFSNLYLLILGVIVYFSFNGARFFSFNYIDIISSFVFGSLQPIIGVVEINKSLWFMFVLFLCLGISCLLTYICQKMNQKPFIFIIPLFTGIIMWFMYKAKINCIFWNDRIPRGLITYFLGFYLGMFLARFSSFSNKRKILIRAVSFVILCSFIALFCTKKFLVYNNTFEISLAVGIGIFPPLFVLMYDIKPINKFCSNRVIVYLAKLSFPMYVLNWVVLNTLYYIDGGSYNWYKSIGAWAFLLFVAAHILASVLWERGVFFVSRLIKKQRTSRKDC